MPKKCRKKTFFLAMLKPLKKRAGSGSVIQWYGKEDPDPYQNVKDPEPKTDVADFDESTRYSLKSLSIAHFKQHTKHQKLFKKSTDLHLLLIFLQNRVSYVILSSMKKIMRSRGQKHKIILGDVSA
jgi:hypothetical protein